jgi:succinate dehydrogenase/fumarate reductase flavoprotein subunit
VQYPIDFYPPDVRNLFLEIENAIKIYWRGVEMKPNYPVMEADVVIVGGGSAGAMAEIPAKAVGPDKKIVVLEKNHAKYSGCIARGMDALNIVSIPGVTTPELYVESNAITCEGIMDEPVNYRMAERSFGVMQRLIDWGVRFPVDEDGNFDILQIHPKGKFCVTMKEPELKTIMYQKMVDAGVEVINRTMAAEAINRGRPCGRRHYSER